MAIGRAAARRTPERKRADIVLHRYTCENPSGQIGCRRVAVTIRGKRCTFPRPRIHSGQETILHNLCVRAGCAAHLQGRSWLVTGVDAVARLAHFPRDRFRPKDPPPFGNTHLFCGSQASIRIFLAGARRAILARGLAAVLRNRGFWADDWQAVDRVIRPFFRQARVE